MAVANKKALFTNAEWKERLEGDTRYRFIVNFFAHKENGVAELRYVRTDLLKKNCGECHTFSFIFKEIERTLLLYFADFDERQKGRATQAENSRTLVLIFPFKENGNDIEYINSLQSTLGNVLGGWKKGIFAEERFEKLLNLVFREGVMPIVAFRRATADEDKRGVDYFLFIDDGQGATFRISIDVKYAPTQVWKRQDIQQGFHCRDSGVFEIAMNLKRWDKLKRVPSLAFFRNLISVHISVATEELLQKVKNNARREQS